MLTQKCDKLWLKDSLLEVEILGCNESYGQCYMNQMKLQE